jgi:chromosome segregation ATPase
MSETKLTVNDLDHTIAQASDAGKQGLSEFKLAISDVDQMLKQLATTGKTWREAGTDLQESSDRLADLITSIEALTEEQKLVIDAVSSAPAAAMKVISEISEVMKIAGRQIESSMREAHQSMSGANKSLENTAAVIKESVNSVSVGIKEYTTQVGELHNSMDENMAKAVTAIGGSIENLNEAIEELSEILDAKIPRT